MRFFKNNKDGRAVSSSLELVTSTLPMFKKTTEEEIRRAAVLIDRGIDFGIRGSISESESCFYELIKIHPELIAVWTNAAMEKNPDGYDREFLEAAISERPINYENVLSVYTNSNRTMIWKGVAYRCKSKSGLKERVYEDRDYRNARNGRKKN